MQIRQRSRQPYMKRTVNQIQISRNEMDNYLNAALHVVFSAGYRAVAPCLALAPPSCGPPPRHPSHFAASPSAPPLHKAQEEEEEETASAQDGSTDEMSFSLGGNLAVLEMPRPQP
ncbi:Protein of unknown function [Gryllus bimaculatus]|nr:Protein of unknown function [Gryllus bimaculatus]